MADAFNVLVVDDNRDVADSTADLIRSSGFSVRVVYSGQQAVRSAQANVPDCVLLDINMPVMDGYAVARALRANPATRGTKLIAFTSYSTASHAGWIKQSGFDYHLVKGVADYAELEGLLKMLREIKKLAEQTKKNSEQNAQLAGETKELLREAKTELRETKGEIKNVKTEITEVKHELREVKEELKEVKEDLKDTKRGVDDAE